MRKKRLILWGVLAAMLILLIVALDQRVVVRRYTIETDAVKMPICLAVLTDCHGCDYGEYGSRLVKRVEALCPDAILLVGDMFTSDGDYSDELQFFRLLDGVAFSYYVTGNHEYWEQDVPGLLNLIDWTGVSVVDQRCVSLVVDGNRLNICGVPDPYAGVNTEDALACAAADIDQPGFNILMAHRPELIEKYAANGSFDLVVSGHAHGGQIRIPFLVNGLYAPNQGWFPKYAGGLYEVDGTTMIVSRGLSTQAQMHIPRIFNRPELVAIELVPAK